MKLKFKWPIKGKKIDLPLLKEVISKGSFVKAATVYKICNKRGQQQNIWKILHPVHGNEGIEVFFFYSALH